MNREEREERSSSLGLHVNDIGKSISDVFRKKSVQFRKELVKALARFGKRFFLNITHTWNEAHSHLFPLKKALPLPQEKYCVCPFCGYGQTFIVLADIRNDSGVWWKRRIIVSCPKCRQFALPITEHIPTFRRTLSASFLPRSGQFTRGTCISKVNARLWTSQSTALNLEPTTRCNFRCWYCIGRHIKQEDLTVENFKRIIDNTSGAISGLSLVGEGEPFLNKDFFEMVSIAKSLGIFAHTLTNGSLLIPSIIEKICKSGLDYIGISVDSLRPEKYAQSRINGSLAQIREGIKRLAVFKKEHGYSRPIIFVTGTLFKETVKEIDSIVEATKEWGVEAFSVFQTINPKQSYVDIYPDEQKHHLKDIPYVFNVIEQSAKRKALPSLDSFISQDLGECQPVQEANLLNGSNCDIPWLYSLVSGQVTPCCQIKNWDNPDWNILEHDIGTVLSNLAYENIRFNLYNGIFLPECLGCGKTDSRKAAWLTA